MLPDDDAELGTIRWPNEHALGGFAYLLGIVSGVLLIVIEDENPHIRFHAMQSTLVSSCLLVASVLVLGLELLVVRLPAGGWVIGAGLAFIGTILWLCGLALWIFLVVTATRGERYDLPVIGSLTERCLRR